MSTRRTMRAGPSPAEPERRRFLTTACRLGPALALAPYLPSEEQDAQEPSAPTLSTEDRVELALTRFKQGFHCSQSVLEAYAADFGIKPEMARRLAAGLAGGSTVGGECGTIGSGYLILGLKHGRIAPSYGETEREEELWGRVRRFVAEFRKRHGALTCRELLGVDAFSPEGRQEALRKNLFVHRCHTYIRDAITILESLA